MFTEFSSGNKPLSLLPRGEEHIFCDPSFFPFFSQGEIRDIFQFCLIFTALQVVTKRKTKVGTVLSRKIM